MINQFCGFILQRDFLISFWSSIFSTVFISLVVALMVNYYTPLFKYPKLILVVKQEGFYRDSIKISERADGDYEAQFTLAIKNRGNQTLRPNEGYWHVYFPDAKAEAQKGAESFLAIKEDNHFRDLIRLPIYPKSFVDFGPEYKLLIKKDNINKARIRFFFATNYGYFPKSVKINQKTGAVAFSDMGSIQFDWSNTSKAKNK